MSFGGVNTFQQYSTDYGIGHNGVKVSFNFFDGIPEPSLLNSLASNDLKLIFKLLLKRDETTKEKALSDLLKLLEDLPDKEYLFDNDIFSLCWSQVYPKLLLSDSKNIRIQSHQVTSKLIKTLNKRISKFLKDLIPLLLLGTCDTDAFVSRSSLNSINEAFNKDSKKINALWILFHEDILNVIKEVVSIENDGVLSDERYVGKDDAQLRYNRLLTAVVTLLVTLLKSDEKKINEHKRTYTQILSCESLWGPLSLKNTLFLKGYEISLQLIQLLYHIGFFKLHKDVLKVSVRKLFKSLSQVNSKNILKVASLMVKITETLTLLDTYKDGRIWSYDKHSKERLKAFLSVCCTSAHPGFFSAMYGLYERTATHELLSYKPEWCSLWKKSVTSLNERPFLGRYGAVLLRECWEYYLKFVSHSEGAILEEDVQHSILETLHGERSLEKLLGLKKILENRLTSDFILMKIETTLKAETAETAVTKDYFLENLVLLLIDGSKTTDSLQALCDILLPSMFQNGKELNGKDSKIVNLYQLLIKSNQISISRELLHFISQVPKWINSNTYAKLASIVVDYSNTETTVKNELYIDSVEKFFSALISYNIPDAKILDVLDRLNDQTLLSLRDSEVLQQFLKSYIDSYNYDDDAKFFRTKLVNKESLIDLYKSSIVNDCLESFCGAAIDLDLDLRENLVRNTDFLSVSLFKRSDECTQKTFEIFKPLINQNADITKKLTNAIVQHAQDRSFQDSDELYIEYALQLIRESHQNVNHFLPRRLSEKFVEGVPFIDYRLAALNCLGLSTHLLPTSKDELNLTNVERLIKYGSFLDTLCREIPSLLTNDVSIFLTMIAELAEDYNCLSSAPQEQFNDINNTLLKSKNFQPSFGSVIEALIKEENDDELSVLSTLFADMSSSVITFYSFRIIYKILLNALDSLTVTSFDRLLPLIEQYTTSVVRRKNSDAHGYIMTAVILSAIENFSHGESLGKFRNLLASECIGAKESEVYETTYKVVILLNIMLKNTSVNESLIPIAPQRLIMMLKTVSEWLDSEMAFDPRFSIMRISLLKMLSSLLMIPAVMQANSSVVDVSARLLIDSLSMAQLEDTDFILELRLYSVSLYQAMSSNDVDLHTSEHENENEIFTCLVELCLTDFKSEANNQLSVIFYKALSKAMEQQDSKGLLDYYDSFLESFLANGGIGNFNKVRLLTGILERLIREKQQEAVVEYELKRQQLQKIQEDEKDEMMEYEEDGRADDEFKLPKCLIQKLMEAMPQEYLEYENEYSFLKYLWYWHLVLQFFDSSSYNLRQLFIEQLKKENLIAKFFDFVTDQIDLHESKFWTSIGSSGILDYSIVEDEFSPYKGDIFMECKRLLAHSLYKMFDNVGSLTTNWWLNIKDRSFQSEVEKFVSLFISPILIRHELDTVVSKMESLTSKDDALNVKINKVTNEVKASYLIDEQKLVLSFKLPPNYPLTNIEVIGVSRVGISEQKWKQWIMSTQRVITGMNGSVMDSLELFTKNVNLQFSGFEECAICYSILHAVDRKLPTKTCPTCNNKFHGACLYKWFRSSGNNTCPLCRSEIPFKR